MAAWLIASLVVLGLWVTLRTVWRMRRRSTFRDALFGETPSFQVTVLDGPEGRVRARLVLGGTASSLRLSRLSTTAAAAGSVALVPPPGWVREDDGAEVIWRPPETIGVTPGEPLDLELGWDPSYRGRPVAVQGWAEGEGVGAGFALLVGPRSAAVTFPFY